MKWEKLTFKDSLQFLTEKQHYCKIFKEFLINNGK